MKLDLAPAGLARDGRHFVGLIPGYLFSVSDFCLHFSFTTVQIQMLYSDPYLVRLTSESFSITNLSRTCIGFEKL